MQKIFTQTLFTLGFLLLSHSILFAQTGTIKGQIIDTLLNESVIGANVVIKGTNIGSSTDIDGNYLITGVAPGTYTLVISYIGYKSKEVEGVQVQSGKVTLVNTNLVEEAGQLQDVVVEAQRETLSEISVISEIKLAEVVAVGVSGEQISKTQDSDGAQVLKRLPGLSLFDERFVMVRGLSERYNAVMLNGVLTPSTEVDVKSFSFDVIPSSVIDRMLVLKSGSPELPGEYAGGIIKIFTKNAPDENFTNIGISGGFRFGTTGETLLRYEGGKTDWLGFDDGTRSLPAGFPTQRLQTLTLQERTDAGRLLTSTWLPTDYSALPDFKVSFGLGRRFQVGKVRIGNLTSLSYGSSRLFLDVERNRYLADFDPTTNRSTDLFRYKDQQSNQTIRIGALHNWSVSLNKDHKIEFRNLFNSLGSRQTVFRQGFDVNQEFNNYSLYYENRLIYTSQLAGEHTFGGGNTTIDWVGGFSYTKKEEPDFRRFQSGRPRGSSDEFTVSFPNTADLVRNGRFFSDLNEYIYTGAVNFQQKIKFRGSIDNPLEIRAGVYIERKNRDFSARWITLVRSQGFNPVLYPQLVSPNFQDAFDPNNIATDRFTYDEGTLPRDSYKADNTLLAGYIGFSIPLTDRFNISTGVRVEQNEQNLNSASQTGAIISVNNPITSFLPSLNLSYNITDKMLIRAAYASSINRPEFRELAPFLYYDFNNEANIEGNPNLKTPSIYNGDLRWEYYPTPAEIIMIGGFYKRFNNPIEILLTGGGNSVYTLQPINAEFSTSYGIELEIRKSLGTVFQNGFFENVSLLLNASYINNTVEFSNTITTQETERPMMFQSPYLINFGLYFNDEEKGWQGSILYNVFGNRIFAVGDRFIAQDGTSTGNWPTQWERPRNVIDLTISKKFAEKFEISLGVQDLLNAPFRVFQDSNLDGKITNVDELMLRYRRGTNVSLGFKFNL